MRISDWSSDVCSSDRVGRGPEAGLVLQDLEGERADLEGNGGFAAIPLAADGEDLAADLPDVGPAPLDHVGGGRQAPAGGVEGLGFHGGRVAERPGGARGGASLAGSLTTRSEERRVGTECVRTGGCRGATVD